MLFQLYFYLVLFIIYYSIILHDDDHYIHFNDNLNTKGSKNVKIYIAFNEIKCNFIFNREGLCNAYIYRFSFKVCQRKFQNDRESKFEISTLLVYYPTRLIELNWLSIRYECMNCSWLLIPPSIVMIIIHFSVINIPMDF